MSLHPSLKVSSAGATIRNVLKRHERVRLLMEQGKWEDGRVALNLPKVKQLRLKARKAVKEKAAEGAAAAPGAATPAAGTAKPAA